MNTTYWIDPRGDCVGAYGCEIVEMHHYGDMKPDGSYEHFCPTGFLFCEKHGEVAGFLDGPGQCDRWDS